MAVTLTESIKLAVNNGQTLKAAIMTEYARSSELLATMPFEDITGNALAFNREANLPSMGFRGLNEGYTESSGKLDRVTESLAIAGGDLDVDKFLVKTQGMGIRSTHMMLKAKSIALGITKNIIKGSVITDPKSFDGFQVRASGDQLIAAGTTDGGDALSLAKLDEAIDACDNPTHLVMSKALARRFSAAARSSSISGNINFMSDELGKRVMYYNDLPILRVDRDETNSAIMPFTEVSNNAGATATAASLYVVSFSDMGVTGIQNGQMEVTDLGELDTKPVYRTRVEWYISMAVQQVRSLVRLWSIKDAAITA